MFPVKRDIFQVQRVRNTVLLVLPDFISHQKVKTIASRVRKAALTSLPAILTLTRHAMTVPASIQITPVMITTLVR